MEPDDKNKPVTALAEIRQSVAEFKAAVETLKQKGELTEAMEPRIKALEEDFKSLEKKTLERQLMVPGSEEDLKKNPFDIHMAVKALKTGNWKEAGLELDYIKEVHKKALEVGFQPNDPSILQKDITAGVGAQGGFLLGVEVDQGIIPLAIDQRPALNEMGIRKLTNLMVGEYHLQKQTSRAQAYWIGELQAPTKSTQTFDRRTLRMKKIAAYCAASNDVLRQGRGSMDGFMRQDLAEALGLGMEDALVQGSGTDFQPKGVIRYSGLTTTSAIGTNGGNLGIRKAAEMALNIRKANMLKGSLGFLTSPEVIHNLRCQGFTSFTGQTTNTGPLNGKIPLSTAELEALVGYKMRDSTRLPINLVKGNTSDNTYVIFGDWSQVVMGMWGGLEIKVSDVASDGVNNMFVQDGFFVHALQTMDITIRDESGLTLISDARTAIAEVVA